MFNRCPIWMLFCCALIAACSAPNRATKTSRIASVFVDREKNFLFKTAADYRASEKIRASERRLIKRFALDSNMGRPTTYYKLRTIVDPLFTVIIARTDAPPTGRPYFRRDENVVRLNTNSVQYVLLGIPNSTSTSEEVKIMQHELMEIATSIKDEGDIIQTIDVPDVMKLYREAVAGQINYLELKRRTQNFQYSLRGYSDSLDHLIDQLNKTLAGVDTLRNDHTSLVKSQQDNSVANITPKWSATSKGEKPAKLLAIRDISLPDNLVNERVLGFTIYENNQPLIAGIFKPRDNNLTIPVPSGDKLKLRINDREGEEIIMDIP